jgi:hypothetical protein
MKFAEITSLVVFNRQESASTGAGKSIQEGKTMSNGYVGDIRQPDKQYFIDVQYVGGQWRQAIDAVNADLQSGKISQKEFWTRKLNISKAMELGLTIAHGNFLDRCDGKNTSGSSPWMNSEVSLVLGDSSDREYGYPDFVS